MTNKDKGFAQMDDKKHKDAASKGGKAGSHDKDHNHKVDHKKK